MAMGGVDDQKIDARVDELHRALEALVAGRRGSGDAQAALIVLDGIGVGDGLLHVLDGDQADTIAVDVDDQQFLDTVLVQEALGIALADALAYRHQVVARHQLVDLLVRVRGKAHVAIGENADQLAGSPAACAAVLDDGNAGNLGLLHQVERVGQRRLGADGDRIDHHAAFIGLDQPHFLGLPVLIEVAVDDAHAARLRHGDGHRGLGHGVHGRAEDRQVELDIARHTSADVGIGRKDGGARRLKQHVVEGECGFAGDRCDDPGQGQTLSAQKAYQKCGVGPPVEDSGGHGVGTGQYHPCPDLPSFGSANSGRYGLMRHPVLKIQVMTPRQASRNSATAPRLTATFTSEMP